MFDDLDQERQLRKAVELVQEFARADVVAMALRREFGHLSAGEIGELLWEGQRSGEIDLGPDVEFVRYLAEAPSYAFGSEDVLDLIDSLAFHHEDGTNLSGWKASRAWQEGDLPGRFSYLDELIDNRLDDLEFLEELAFACRRLPSPWDIGLEFELARHGVLTAEDLSEELLDAIVAEYTEAGAGSLRDWMQELPWSQADWHAILGNEAHQPDAVFENPAVLAELAKFSSTEQLLDAAGRVCPQPGVWTAVSTLVEQGEEIFEPLESALLELRVGPYPAEHDQPWPAVVLVPAYLHLCDQLGRTPDPRADAPIADFIARRRDRARRSALDTDAHHAQMRQALAALPEGRLVALFSQPARLDWTLLPAIAHPDILEMLPDALRLLPRMPNTKGYGQPLAAIFHRQVGRVLSGLGEAGLPALSDALEDASYTVALMVVRALRQMRRDATAPMLVRALALKNPKARDLAGEALLELDDNAVLDALPEMLGGRLKAWRLAAAQVLAEMPPSERRFELAREHLESERTRDVKDILETIQPPPSVGDVDRDEIRRALERGEDWRELVDRAGRALIDLLVEHLGGKLYTREERREEFAELIEMLHGEPGALEQALLAVTEKSFGARRLVSFLDRRLDGVPEALGGLVGIGRLHGFGDEDAIDWIAANAPDRGRAALLAALDHGTKAVRETSMEGLVGLGDAIVADLLDLLTGGEARADARQAAALALAEIAAPSAVDRLAEALDAERSKRVRAAMERAMSACGAAGLRLEDFPGDQQGDAALDAALADIGLPRPEELPEQLPPLRWRSGRALSEGAIRWFLAELLREDRQTHSERLYEVRCRLDDETCHALCDALVGAASEPLEAPEIYVRATIGAPGHIDEVGEALETLASSAATHWGDDGVEVLVRHGSDAAAQWLDHWKRKTRKGALRRRAKRGLMRLAQQRGMSVDDLVFVTTPTFGFDRSGQQILDYGPRHIVARLDAQNGVVYVDEKGEVRKRRPRARKSDDSAKVEAVKERFRAIRRRINRANKALSERLERAMVMTSTWSVEQWENRFLDHPLVFSLATALVFEARAGERRELFSLAAEGVPIDAAGDEIALGEEAEISIVHPVYMSERERAAWAEHLEMRDAYPPFEQLSRSIFVGADAPRRGHQLVDALPRVPGATLWGRLHQQGYEPGERRGRGRVSSASKRWADVKVEIHFDPIAPDALQYAGPVSVTGVSVFVAGKSQKLGKLADHLRSEIARDAHLLCEP